MEVIEAVKDLMLDTLDTDFIESVWSHEFMGSSELPAEYKEHFDTVGIQVLSEIINAVDSWQAEDSLNSAVGNAEDKNWKQLIELKLNYKALLPVLWCFITKGQREKTVEVARFISLRASTLYLKLLAVPGSRVFHAFHPYLCLKAVTVLKLGNLIANAKQKKSKKQNRGMEEEDFDLDEIRLTQIELVFLAKELVMVIQALQIFVSTFSLESEEDLLEEIVERLAEITRLEVNTSNFVDAIGKSKSHSDAAFTPSLVYNAYECLKLLCSPQHGDVEDLIIIVMKHLLPGVLLNDRELSFRELCVIREHTVFFIKYLVFSFQEASYRGTKILLHHVFTRIGEKAEVRQKGRETILDLMRIVPSKYYMDLMKWFFDCAHCDRASYRLLAVEVLSQLLYEHQNPEEASVSGVNIDSAGNLRNSINDIDANHQIESEHLEQDAVSIMPMFIDLSRPTEHVISKKYILAVIFARFRDSSAIVRTKAVTLLAQCLKSENMIVRSLINEIFVLNSEQDERNQRGILNYKQIIAAFKGKSAFNPLPNAESVLMELKTLACDSKVSVRKAALQVLEGILKLNRSWLSGNILKLMGNSCRDPAVSIRKEMVQVLSDLLQQYPDDKQLPQIWTKSVVPLLLDQEGKLQECVLKTMRFIIVDHLTEYRQPKSDDIWYTLPWQLLTHIVKFNLHFCFMKACEIWVKDKEIRSTLVKDICTHVGMENNLAAWIVLYCLSSQMELKNPMFAVDYYRRAIASNEGSVSLLVIVLEVLLSCCTHLPQDVQKDMLNELITSLCNFAVQRELIRLNVEIAVELTYQLSESKKHAQKKIRLWTAELLQLSQVYLEDKLRLETTKVVDEDLLLRHLHTLGEVAMHNPQQVSDKTFLLLQQYLSIPESVDVDDVSASPVTKALAVVSVGKLCILNQMWAKKSAKLLLKLLKSAQDLPTVMNIMFVLRDLCVRYGAMMEPYLPSLWICLKDVNVEIRLTALTCLVELLQGNYIKLRGAMFFHLLTMLRDSDETVTELATYFLRDCLPVSNKNIMYEHFIDALFHYNGYVGHEVYGKCMMTEDERKVFSLIGHQFSEDREYIYGFMLETMDDEHRMQSRNNLVMKVLDAAAEGHVMIDGSGESVILDALHILNSKQIKLTAFQPSRDEESTTESLERVTNLFVNARNKAIAECEKKYMIEYIVPVVIHLKAVLQEKYSRLVRHLMLYLRDMMKEYKNEVKEIFAEDRQMAIEILFDIGELEKKQKNCENEQEEVASPNVSNQQVPSRISSLLQSASPWVRNSLGPEIIKCYNTGGEELVAKYARTKLHHIRSLNEKECELIRRRRSRSMGESSEYSLQELKQEHRSEISDPVEPADLDYDMEKAVACSEEEGRECLGENREAGRSAETESETFGGENEERMLTEEECQMEGTEEHCAMDEGAVELEKAEEEEDIRTVPRKRSRSDSTGSSNSVVPSVLLNRRRKVSSPVVLDGTMCSPGTDAVSEDSSVLGQ